LEKFQRDLSEHKQSKAKWDKEQDEIVTATKARNLVERRAAQDRIEREKKERREAVKLKSIKEPTPFAKEYDLGSR
jgi:hypothetical protein